MLHTIGSLAGGLGLLLLAIAMMTSGLRNASGPIVRKVLTNWTRTPLRGVATGAGMTALVQSSSAITVAVIGFVNAGMLSLNEALGVVYGANVGTTVTGWLVTLVGFEFDIKALALPLIGAGVFMRMLGNKHHLSAIGEAIAGFGLFFIGIDFMKEAFEHMVAAYAIQPTLEAGFFKLVSLIASGFILTVLTQSSSAAMAIILTAAAGGMLSIVTGAAMVIGANLGTTSTAVISVLDAGPNARRTAAAHVVFNALTAAVALFILPMILMTVGMIEDILGLERNVIVTLAIFHTVFNVLGVLIMLPLTGRLSQKLMKYFKTLEEDLSRPQYLDKSILSAPAMAVTALSRELERMLEISANATSAALLEGDKAGERITANQRGVNALSNKIAEYSGAMRQMAMASEVSNVLPFILRIDRYIREATRLVGHAQSARAIANSLREEIVHEQIHEFLRHCAALIQNAAAGHAKKTGIADLEREYHALKDSLLDNVARREIDISRMGALLDNLSHVRRMTGQTIKARRYLKTLNKRLHPKKKEKTKTPTGNATGNPDGNAGAQGSQPA